MTMFSNTSDSFGILLKQFRKRQHLTQQQVAEALGIHRNTIGRWEEGSFLPESKTSILELARCLRLSEPETRQLLDTSFIIPTPAWSVPYPRNPFFTGREDLLATLHAHLSPDQQVALTQSYALHGLGGVGKTQLALEYAYRYALEYRAVFWIGAETLEQIHAGLLNIAQRLDLPERMEPDQQRMVAAVQRWLETRSEWLLIWDNLEDPDLLLRFLPSLQRGALLVTTRYQTLGTMAYGIDLAPMEKEEGALFLLRRAKILGATVTSEQVRELAVTMPGEYATALDLVTTLGGLPLALDQAGAYIEETKCSLANFLTLFRHTPLRLLQERGTYAAHPASVVTTFALAFEQLQQNHPAAAELLTACCFLAPEEIPESLFTHHAMLLSSGLRQALVEPFAFHEIVKKLLAYALLWRHPERQTLVVHRLVQAVLRGRMNMQEQTVWMKQMISVLNASFPEVTHDVWDECERLLPHVLACVADLPDQIADWEILVEVLRKAADYLRERAHYKQAEALYQRALHIIEQVSESEPLSLTRILQSLLILYRGQGKYKQAEILGERVLHLREQVLDPMHVEVATSLSNLASLYLEQGHYGKAEPLYRRALDIFEQAYGPEHPSVARSLNNLALLYTEQGKYEQAEPLYQRSLSLREQALEPGHPLLGQSLNNLARLYTEQGKYAQAELLYQRTLSIWERALGPDHPELTEPLNNLARLYAEQDKCEQAQLLYQRALLIRKQTFESEHPQMAYSLNGLANLSQKLGENEQAEALYRRALRIREHIWGEHHPETAQTLYDLSVLHQQQGNLQGALSLAERALKIRLQSLGSAHPKTAISQAHHAQLLQELENIMK